MANWVDCRWVIFSLVWASLSACRCGPGVTNTDVSFTVEPQAVEFGRVLEGTLGRQTIKVQSTGRGTLTFTALADAPFDAPGPLERELLGGAEVTLELTYFAGATETSGTLTLTGSNEQVITVPLHALGVHPKDCRPSAPCRDVAYVLETDACVETTSPNGSSCTPTSNCIEKATCVDGRCLGVQRSCDDKDICTVDRCSEESGCLNTRKTCARPANPCKVATCDPVLDCVEENAPDFTVCGRLSCVLAEFCVSGACESRVPPDDTPCSPPTPCQGEGRCKSQVCVRPDAGVLQADWVQPLVGEVKAEAPALQGFEQNLYLQVCAAAADGGFDAGTDGGLLDGGELLGPCALVSYTPTGFERFTQPFEGVAARRLAAPTGAGLSFIVDGGLELYGYADGVRRGQVELKGLTPERLAVDDQGRWWAAAVASDGGTALWRAADGGPELIAGLELPIDALALDENAVAWLFSADAGVVVRATAADGGAVLERFAAAPGASGLSATALGAIAAGRTLVLADGGVRALTLDAGVERLSMPLLIDSQLAVAFERRCEAPDTSCNPVDTELWVKAFFVATGQPAWEAKVASRLLEPQLHDAALSSFSAGAVVALTSIATGEHAVEMYVDGSRVMRCPLPVGTEVVGSYFGSGSLFTLTSRDAGTFLEAYPLNPLPLRLDGWPAAFGAQGQRRAQ